MDIPPNSRALCDCSTGLAITLPEVVWWAAYTGHTGAVLQWVKQKHVEPGLLTWLKEGDYNNTSEDEACPDKIHEPADKNGHSRGRKTKEQGDLQPCDNTLHKITDNKLTDNKITYNKYEDHIDGNIGVKIHKLRNVVDEQKIKIKHHKNKTVLKYVSFYPHYEDSRVYPGRPNHYTSEGALEVSSLNLDALELGENAFKSSSVVNANTEDGETLLHATCSGGRMGVLWLLLKHPYLHLNKRDHLGATPLMLAAWGGHHECVRLLLQTNLKCRLDVNVKDRSGETAVSLALQRDQWQVLNQLLQPGPSILQEGSYLDVDTLAAMFHRLVSKNQIALLVLFLHKFNGTSALDYSALEEACEEARREGHTAIVELLEYTLLDKIMEHYDPMSHERSVEFVQEKPMPPEDITVPQDAREQIYHIYTFI